MRTNLRDVLEALALTSGLVLAGCGEDKDDSDEQAASATMETSGTEAGCPGSTAGCPGSTAGCPGSTAGCPGSTAGCPSSSSSSSSDSSTTMGGSESSSA